MLTKTLLRCAADDNATSERCVRTFALNTFIWWYIPFFKFFNGLQLFAMNSISGLRRANVTKGSDLLCF